MTQKKSWRGAAAYSRSTVPKIFQSTKLPQIVLAQRVESFKPS